MISNDSFFQQVKIGGVYMGIRGSFSKAGSEMKYFVNLKKVNEELNSENEALLAVDSVKPQFTYISAKIVSNGTNNKHNFIIIDKGRDSGVEEDMGVVSPNGVVGVVSSVSDSYSYVISMLNINQSVSAKIGTSGAFGPLIWDGKRADYALLTEIPQHMFTQAVSLHFFRKTFR